MNDTQTEVIANYCKRHKEVVAVYLFGSRAGNTHTKQSDVDIAVLLKNETVQFDLLDCIISLEREFQLPVDAVILNRAGEILKYQVRLRGVLLYESDALFRKEFEVRSRKYFEDFQYIHKRYTRDVLYGDINGRPDVS
ncbi:MAG TPA: nucleotidyltransferase domain-containing protein [Desulfocapsa sulfexigens]|nr:nucleotidyltransferase domain-containing protein [Desulfocapsa sulfexigens]